MTSAQKELVHSEIAAHALIKKAERELVAQDGGELGWFLNIKGILLKPRVLNAVSELFWEHLEAVGQFQVGGIETTAIALVAATVMKAQESGRLLNAFYCRKSRKVDGVQRQIEGVLTDEPVILLDDSINSGKSIIRQVEALKAEGKTVAEVCVIVAFRDASYYTYFAKNNIRIWSIFTLDDFPDSGGLLQPELSRTPAPTMPFELHWKFESENPRYELVLPKSAPVVDAERVYFGSDNGTMWALNQSDGSVAWSHHVLFGSGKKRIFSSPALYKGTLFFGAYDGNFYALDAATGRKRWVNFDSDWIGSSPCVAEDLGLVYVGLEYGLWKKHGGIAAFDAATGEKKWHASIESYVHSSPTYSQKFNLVAVGSKNGDIFAFNARTGALQWQFTRPTDVRGGLVFDEERGLLLFGSWDQKIYMIDAQTGTYVKDLETYKPLYSSPVLYSGRLYMGLMDKRIVCIDIDTAKIIWQYQTQSRVFATPTVIDGKLYCGSNDGRLYELDPLTGTEISFFQTTERIVNKIAYNPATKRMFLPTYANELYCLSRKSD